MKYRHTQIDAGPACAEQSCNESNYILSQL
jgi:hypothetical protein